MVRKLLYLSAQFFLTCNLFAQTEPFGIYLEPLNIPNVGGIQSYAFGQDNGKWLIIGGRLDGLHRRQPFAAFDAAGHNIQMIVIDPVSEQKWSAPLTSLPISIQEQLSSTNMEFHQEGNYLYIIGGYGYSNSELDHITYPNLSAVHVPNVINSIINGTSFTSEIRQITDTMFAVTGGVLNKINNTYQLTGGQKFIGRYNPMGPNQGPGFIQIYTNANRRFELNDDGTNITINHLSAMVDAVNLHRRDYNVVPQIMPNGNEGITAFSGVFQVSADLPFLNCVNIDSTSYTVNNAFSQYYNHYHCAHIPLYSEVNNEMHTLFFGGIAQYYDNAGTLVQDNNVPFVKTIARVTRDVNGIMAEYKLPIEMPDLLGASSEFIPVENISQYNNGVLKMDDFTADTTLLGYIYGGISSTAANIFFINTGVESSASSEIFKVYFINNTTMGTPDLNDQSTGTLKMNIYPNPNNGEFMITFNLTQLTETKITIFNSNGRKIEEKKLTDLIIGENSYQRRIKKLDHGGIYFVTIETSYEKATQKVIIESE
jgi:hypothetical protein